MYDIGEVFWLQIEYEDEPNQSKKRPAIIIDKIEGHLFILVATTTQPPSDPPSYFDQFKIPILNWRIIGFPKPSWGLGYRLIKLAENDLVSVINPSDHIGRFNKKDLQYLIDEIESLHKEDP